MLFQASAATDGASGHALAAFCAEVKANLKSLGMRSPLASSHDWNLDSSSSELEVINKGEGQVTLSLTQQPREKRFQRHMDTDRIKRVRRLPCVKRKGYCCRYPPCTITSPFILTLGGYWSGYLPTHYLPSNCAPLFLSG